MASYTFVDLFSGCGGLSLGLAMAGMSGRFAVERDAMAFETFAANFLGDEHAPIPQFQWPDWLEKRAWGVDEILEKHKADLKKLRGTIDVLAGGPPCQGFSFAGRRKEEDPRNLLFEKYVEVVAAIRPKVLVLENVPGMRVAHASSNVVDIGTGKREKRKSFYDKLLESLDKANYDVRGIMVDASRYGVPQKRSRLIAIGVRKDLLEWIDGADRVVEFLERSRKKQLTDLQLGDVVSAKDALSDLEIGSRLLGDCLDPASPVGFKEANYLGPRSRYQQVMHQGVEGSMDSMRLAKHHDHIKERFAQIISECRQGVRMDDASRAHFGVKKHRIYPMSPSDPAPTITTLPDDILHYSEPRILTVRECARLQSFPDWFHFKGKYTTGGSRRTKECPRYTQVGNAVPPFLARAIGLAVGELLQEVDLRKRFCQQAEPAPKLNAKGRA